MITYEQANDLLEYREGNLYWKRDVINGRHGGVLRYVKGQLAGCYNHKTKRRTISLLNRNYFDYRIIWLLVYGGHPAGLIDHINGDPSDNRLENLRCVSSSVNVQNQRRPLSSKKSGLPLGVYLCKRKDGVSYSASIYVQGRSIWLGCYKAVEDAAQAYIDAKRKYHEGCTI